jgi:hypothetical protein
VNLVVDVDVVYALNKSFAWVASLIIWGPRSDVELVSSRLHATEGGSVGCTVTLKYDNAQCFACMLLLCFQAFIQRYRCRDEQDPRKVGLTRGLEKDQQ